MEDRTLDERHKTGSGLVYCEVGKHNYYTEAAFLSRFEEVEATDKIEFLNSKSRKKPAAKKGNGLLYKETRTGCLRSFELSCGEYKDYPGIITSIAPPKKKFDFTR